MPKGDEVHMYLNKLNTHVRDSAVVHNMKDYSYLVNGNPDFLPVTRWIG